MSTENIYQEIDEFNEYCWGARAAPTEATPDILDRGLENYEKALGINYTYGLARASLNLGMGAFLVQSDYNKATHYLNQAIKLFEEIKDLKWIANTYLISAIINNSVSNSETALYNSLKGITYYETLLEYDVDAVMAYYIVGTVFKDLKKTTDAECYFNKAIEKSEGEHSSWIGRIYTSFSNLYNDECKFDEALVMANKAITVLRSQKNLVGESRALNDVGLIYKKQKIYTEALNYFHQALCIRENLHIKQFSYSSYYEIATVHKELNDYEKAIEFFEKAKILSTNLNQPAKQLKIYLELAAVHKLNEDYINAFNCSESYIKLSKEVSAQEMDLKLSNLKTTILLEKDHEIERLKNVELKNAYQIITDKNKEITDSLLYAKRIQNALLPNKTTISKYLPNHFIYFKPKDIVSGDFYWSTFYNDKFYLAVCDSTGHGVPGAFMSLLNIGFLNEAVKEKNITKPNEIFNYVRTHLINSISNDGQKDGMDSILMCIDFTTNMVTYSAANNAPILIRNNEIKKLQYDKMPVGADDKIDSFTLYTFTLEKGDALYLYTDGYADQFGGEKGKKFKYKPLNELLLSILNEPIEKQCEILKKTFDAWKGNLEQVDDVCVIGIKF